VIKVELHVMLPCVKLWTLIGCMSLLVLPLTASAQVKQNPWSVMTSPAKGTSTPIGDYSSGCLRGGAKLALDGPGFQVMHPSRLRYYGHPELVTFIEGLGRALHTEVQGDVLVGDLSQPRGGPAPGGHSSHQTGLDVDLWYWQPKAAAKRPLTREERETLKSRSVLDPKTSGVQAEWSARVLSMLRLTANDAHVSRMFVHPIIKREACKVATGDRAWLRKVRPWYGHDDHFHVRLLCPADAPECVSQAPVPGGDGCKELDWWFSPEAQQDRKEGQAKYQSKVGKSPGMPVACRELLDKPSRAPQPAAADAASKTPASPPQAAAAPANALPLQASTASKP
jgi:penicillin-insensitive murein endopeptidase